MTATSTASRRDPESDRIAALFEGVSAPTIAGVLLKWGIRNSFMQGITPLFPEKRLFGRARTLRYLPLREDRLLPRERQGEYAHRRMYDLLQPGDVLVCDQGGCLSAGGLGNVVALALQLQGVTGIVVDGAVRDAMRLAAVDVPVYARGVHGASGVKDLLPVDLDVPVACGGVQVWPGDYLLGDADGVSLIPAALVDEVAELAHEQEVMEQFAIAKIRQGHRLNKVYPPSKAYESEYESFKQNR